MHHADGVPHILGRYRLTGKRLGRGNYASVEEAVQLDLETHVAVKIIDTSRVQDPYALRNLHREAALLRRLKHPHIIAIFECMRVGQLYCIVTELVAGGELSAYVQRQPRGHLDERTTLLFGAQLVAALGHMHERGVVHRDLKMRNILLSKTCDSVKIVDFGLSNLWSPSKPLHTHCGSPGYAAPEIYVYNRTYGPEVDLWSLGVVFYAMAVGKLPFPTSKEKNATAHERRKRLLAQIVRGATETHVKAMSHFSPPFRDLVQGLLTAPAARRLTLQQAQEHPWLSNRLRIKQINAQPYQLHSREHALILTKLAVMLNMSVASIEAHCRADRLGEVAAMYNILAHKQLSSYHTSWGLRRAAQKERDPSERQRYLSSQSKPYPSSAPSGSQTQRCSVHTLPPRIPSGGRIPSVPRSVGISDAMKLSPTPISQDDSFPCNTLKGESWHDKHSSKSPRSLEDLRSIIAAQSQATEPSSLPQKTEPSSLPQETELSSQPQETELSSQPQETEPQSKPQATELSSQPEATTPMETNRYSTEKLDVQSIPLVEMSKNTENTQKESTLKEDFCLVGTLSKHTEDSQKESALTEDFVPNGEAEQSSFRGSSVSVNTKNRLHAKKTFKKLVKKESKTNESRKGTTKKVQDVHKNEVLKDGETLQNTNQDTTTANCQSNDVPVTSDGSHSNITHVQSHHTSIVLTKSARATLSSALSNKTRKSVSFSLIALSDPSASANSNKSTLESPEIKDINSHDESKNATLNGKECSRFKSLLTASIEGTSELQELSENNMTELNNNTEIPLKITEDTSHQREINEMSPVQGKVLSQQASSMDASTDLKADQERTSAKVAGMSKMKGTASQPRKEVTHNIASGSHCQEDSALSKQSAITSQHNVKTIAGALSANLATKDIEAQCSGAKFAAAILVKTSPILRALNPEPKKSMHEKVRLTGKSPKALYKLLKQQPKPLNLFDGYTFKNPFISTNNAQTETEIITVESSNATTQIKINQEETDKITQTSIELPSKQDGMMSEQEEMMSTQALDSKPPLKNQKSALDAQNGPKLFQPKDQACKECATDTHERTVKSPVTKSGAESETYNLIFKIHTRAHSKMTEKELTTQQLHNAKHQCNIQGARKTHYGQMSNSSPHRTTKPNDKDTSRNNPTTKAKSSSCTPRLKARTRRKTQLSQRITPNKYKIDIALQKAIERSKRFPFSTMNGAWNAGRRNSVHHKTERKWL